MDTSTFGHSFVPAPDAKKARKTKQSLPLFRWLAHCDDISSGDIIIVIVNTVPQHEELLHLMVGAVLGEQGKPQTKGGAIANLEPVLRSQAPDGTRQSEDRKTQMELWLDVFK